MSAKRDRLDTSLKNRLRRGKKMFSTFSTHFPLYCEHFVNSANNFLHWLLLGKNSSKCVENESVKEKFIFHTLY